jgi:scytalone dehydratase
LCPNIRWGEYDFDKIFESGREELGEKDQAAKTAQQAAGVPAK